MKRKMLYTSIVQRLKYQILSGELVAGIKLPPERKLADAWGVSRNTIVNAFAELEAEGLIRTKVGSGRFVKPVPPSDTNIDWKRELVEERPQNRTSPITTLHDVSGTKSMFNFAVGEGGKHTLANAGFSAACDFERILDNLQSNYLTPTLGHPALRAWIAQWFQNEMTIHPDNVMITSGSQEALYLCATILAKPGDSVAVEIPAFFGALQVFQTLGFHVIPIPVDGDGMRVEILEGVLQRTRPRFIFVNPTFQNPTGTVMSLARRERLLSLSEKYGIPIIEDDAYRYLHFESDPPVSLKALDQRGNVIYIHTFSKLLFPGLRLGWVTANRPFIEVLIRRKELSATTNTFTQQALLMYLQGGTFETHLSQLRILYRNQAGVMENFLRQCLANGIHYAPPAGGFYFWVALPDHVNALEFVNLAGDNGVLITNGDLFMTREVRQPYIRLSYSHETEERIQQGMQIVTSLLKSL